MLLRIQLPDGMTAAEACARIRGSLPFGELHLQVLYVTERPPDDNQDS